MIKKINENLDLVNKFRSESKEEVEAFRVKYLGKKGILNSFFDAFKTLPSEQKKEFGALLNKLKNAVVEKVKVLQSESDTQLPTSSFTDLSRPDFHSKWGLDTPSHLLKIELLTYLLK